MPGLVEVDLCGKTVGFHLGHSSVIAGAVKQESPQKWSVFVAPPTPGSVVIHEGGVALEGYNPGMSKAAFEYNPCSVIGLPMSEVQEDLIESHHLKAPLHEAWPETEIVLNSRLTRATPPMIESLILANLVKELASGEENHVACNAVISVPPHFTKLQRAAVTEAGQLAGLTVLRTLSRPVAVTLAQGLTGPCMVTVLHMGGATVNASLVRIDEAGHGELLHTVDASENIGGDAFDEIMLSLVEQNRVRGPVTPDELSESLESAREAKIELSMSSEAKVSLTKKKNDTAVVITQKDFEEACLEPLQKAMALVESLLSDIQVDRDEVELCIISGGTAKVPGVENVAKSYFLSSPRVHISLSANSVSAHGAAVHAGQIRGECPAEIGSVPMGRTDISMEVMSMGTEAGFAATIAVHGVAVLQSAGMQNQGFNVVVLNQLTGEVQSSRIYDTRSDPACAEDLERELLLLPEGRVVIAAICGETRNINVSAEIAAEAEARIQSAFMSCGSEGLPALGYRCSWCFIGTKGEVVGSGEAIAEKSGSGSKEKVLLSHQMKLASDPESCRIANERLTAGCSAVDAAREANRLGSAAAVDDLTRVKICRSGAVAGLCKAMYDHDSNRDVQIRGVMALYYLSMAPATRGIMIEAGAIQQLAEAIAFTGRPYLPGEGTGLERAYAHGVNSLANLTQHPEAAECIIETNILTPIVGCIQDNGQFSQDPDCVSAGLNCLALVLKRSMVGGDSSAEGILNGVVKAGGPKACAIMANKHSAHPGVQTACCHLISALVVAGKETGNADCKGAWAAGGAQVAVKAIRMAGETLQAGHAPVVRSGCKTLACLAESGAAHALRVEDARGVEACALALHKMVYSMEVATSVVDTLTAIAQATHSETGHTETAEAAWLATRPFEEVEFVTMGLNAAVAAFSGKTAFLKRVKAFVNT